MFFYLKILPQRTLLPMIFKNYCNKSDKNAKLNDLLQSLIDKKPTKIKLELAKPKRKLKEKKDDKNVDTTNIENAAMNVAKILGGDTKQIQSELLSKLLEKDKEKQQTLSVVQLIEKMKIDNTKTSAVRIDEAQRTKKPKLYRQKTVKAESIDLFGGERLFIFKEPDKTSSNVVLNTWNHLQERELRLEVTHPPTNYFQQSILWTEQGKLWQFPIDNEQGMEQEHNTYFADHVFLEQQLDDWCPKQGPIRHFMELVCVGLSKNYWLNADEKRSHIEWYKNYFLDKIDLLREVGAVPVDSKSVKTN